MKPSTNEVSQLLVECSNGKEAALDRPIPLVYQEWHDLNGVLMPPPLRIKQRLDEADKVHDRMVFVPEGDFRIAAWKRPAD
jgi:hypothetical protein